MHSKHEQYRQRLEYYLVMQDLLLSSLFVKYKIFILTQFKTFINGVRY